jgi:uncharacterized protein
VRGWAMKDDKSGAVLTNLALFCKSSGQRAGSTALTGLQRLAGSFAAATDGQAEWSVQGSTRVRAGGAPQLWLNLRARAVAPLQCQRCLSPVALPLEVDREVLLVHGEEQAARLDEELEDDVLALPERLNLLELLEDELILALPIVPRHDGDCPNPLAGLGSQAGAADDADEQPERVHPFAVLAQLKGRGKG